MFLTSCWRSVSNCCLRQFFSYITTRTSSFSMRWRWGPNTLSCFFLRYIYCSAHQTLYEFGENCLTCGLTRRKYPLKNWKVLKEIAEIHPKATRWFIYLKVCVSLVAVYEMQWSAVSWKVDKMPVLWAISVHHTYCKVKLSCFQRGMSGFTDAYMYFNELQLLWED